jgi:hypothetical protein
MSSCVCAICGNRKAGQQNWYLIAENPWEDRVRIMRWESCLALSPGILSACGAAHVRELLIQWLNSEILASNQKSLPPIFARAQGDFFHTPAWELAAGMQPIGELAVHRRTLQDSPATLRSVLDAVFHALQDESPDAEIFAEQNVLSYSPCSQEIMGLAQSASA